ncbi:MAG: hypothetical protein KC502_16710 [Myxococcales bacterium]|nr:hypothetical protein [Myxococcales bacterium]
METLLKRHFWVINLLGLAIIAWLVGGSVNGFVGMKLSAASSNDIDVAGLKAGAGSSALADKLRSARAGNGAGGAMEAASPFLIDEPPAEQEPEPEEEPDEEEEPDGPVIASLEVTKLPLKLLGTMVVTPAKYSSGTMEVNRKEKKIIRVGLELLGGQARVEGIFRRYVVLKESNKLTVAPLWPRPSSGKSGSATAARAPTVRSPSRPPTRASRASSRRGKNTKGVRRISSTSYQLERGMINRKLKNLASLGQQVRVVPNYHRGKYDGFRMIGMGSSSMFRDIGFQNGDIIKVINGGKIDSPNKALALYEALKNKSRLTVQIERGGMLKTMRYIVR